ncbi:ABC transporter ATP-binding protein [Psychroserpens ponticola]|uniref:ABC transporter ATP-binding protein n=1 Tax=Psychroserpens ponticola TaxID=2932268 RepID=A0ABY7RX99_9FLAO|nr:ABC transporter ATP-binding protein [Psychroserpens ponticola]WCO01769.1 ABC transporter ATP-binding protein [Psychroserpens ponticola]
MLQVKNLSFSYNKTKILNHINFSVNLGENISIIGESGSGKTTLLKLLYGEYDLDSGSLFWGKQQILGPKYNLVIGYDFIKYVAQEFDLMPYISVEENIGKFLSNFFPEEKQKRTKELLEVVELTKFAHVKVKTLSGGQKQRVALARALAKEPEIILLDEPFSHIDNFKKQSLRRRVFNYLKDKKITCIVATHDKNDVLEFANRIILLNNAEIEANDTPKYLFQNPNTPLIASFFDEFNTINNEIVYAHQLGIVEKSNIQVIVNKNYFKGTYYLIESYFENETIFFEHFEELSEGNTVYLSINK